MDKFFIPTNNPEDWQLLLADPDKQWRKEYNQIRPHSAKNYRPPAPETIITMATT